MRGSVGGSNPSRMQVGVALFLVYVLWGSTYLAIRFAVESLPPFGMAAARFLAAGALLYGWARMRGAERPSLIEWKSSAVVGLLMLFGANGAVVWAEQAIPSALAALLVSTVPLFMAVIEWLRWGNRPSPAVAVGLLIGFGGVALLVGPSDLGGASVVPVLMCIVAAVAWAIGSLYGRRAPAPRSQLLGAAMQMLSGGFALAIASVASGEKIEWAAASGRSVGSLLYLVVFGSLIGFTAYSWLMRNVVPSLASTYAYVNPVVAVLLGWALAGEVIGTRTIVASALVIGSVGLITLARIKKPAAVAVAVAEAPAVELPAVEPVPSTAAAFAAAVEAAAIRPAGPVPDWAKVPRTDRPSGEWPAMQSR